MDLSMSVRSNSEHNYLNSALIYDMKNYADLETGLLIFRAVADPRNSQKNEKYREIHQKYGQIHVGKTYLILILAIRPVLFTPNVQI